MTATRTIQVVAPSRLHFGLLAFGQEDGRQYGGVGAMIQSPSVRLRIAAADRLRTSGPLAVRAAEFARRWAAFQSLGREPACHIDVIQAPRQHTGLGVGTQLGLSVAAGLTAFFDWPMPSPAELAISVGRGRRSAVGTYGFAQGGLIADGGRWPHEVSSRLDCRLDLPAAWRFVLICPRAGQGLSGADEQQAFASLPAVARPTTDWLRREVRDRMMPAAAQTQFDQFSDSVYRFGRLAGMCFARYQGGPYNGRLLSQIVQTIRSLGVRGVGQSSWGPTLFAVLPSQADAEQVAARLARIYPSDQYELWISAPNNRGARVTRSIASGERGVAVPYGGL